MFVTARIENCTATTLSIVRVGDRISSNGLEKGFRDKLVDQYQIRRICRLPSEAKAGTNKG